MNKGASYISTFNETSGDYDTFNLADGASPDFVLTCIDNDGNAEWRDLSSLGVTSIQGTANQVLANGNSGTQETGDVILTLPQDIATTSSPTFNKILLDNGLINAPSFSFADETDTGMYKYAAGTLALVLGGSVGYIFNTAGLTMPGNAITGVSSLNLAGTTFSICGESQPSTIWQYTKSINQNVATTSSPTFVNITGTLLTNSQPNITSLGNLTGLTVSSGTTSFLGSSISSTQWGYLAALDQSLITTSNTRFGTLAIGSLATSGSGIKLDVQSSSGESWITNTGYGAGSAPRFIGRRAGGTQASPSATTSSINLCAIDGRGRDDLGNWTGAVASILLSSNQAFTSTAQGTNITMSTTPNNSITPVTRLTIANDGTVQIASNLSSINGTSISGTQWGYLGALNQAVTTTSAMRAGSLAVGSTTTVGSGFTIDAQALSGECWIGATGFGSGAPSRFMGRRAGGTQASPSATPSGVTLCVLDARGRDDLGNWTGSVANVGVASAQAFTSTAQGTVMTFQTTPNGSTTPATRLTINQDGTVVVAQNLSSINGTSISTTQWGYVGGLNQALTTSSNVTFGNIAGTLTTGTQNSITALGGLTSIQGVSGINATKVGYWVDMDQKVSTTSGPTLGSLIVTGVISSINGQSFNSSKWGYLNSINQNLSSADSPLFNTLNCTTLSCSGNVSGTLSTAAQTNITSVGTLTSLTVTNNVSCGSLTVNGSAVTIPTSGTYTPTLTLNSFSNGSVTAATVRWQRIDNVVFLVGSFTMNYVTDFTGDVYMTLPFSQNNFSGTTSAQGFCNVQNWTVSGSFSTYCNVASRTSNQQLTFTPVIWNAGTAPLSTSIRWSFSISYDVV